MERDAILSALKSVKDPSKGRDIVDLKYIRDLELSDSAVKFKLVLGTPLFPSSRSLEQAAREAVLRVSGVKSADISLESRIPVAGASEGKQPVPGVGNILAVSSGKGGVG